MPRIPASCHNCGLLFPSGFNVGLGAVLRGNRSSCPRCGGMADVLEGYTTLIRGVVTFVESPRHEIAEKQLLFQTAKEVGAGRVRAKDAVRDLEGQSPDGGRLLREWATFGLTIVATMAAVGSFLLSYQQSKGNAPLEEMATQKFEEVICTQPQPDMRSYRPAPSGIRPVAMPSNAQPGIEERNSATARPEPPKENRKARRARIKKERSDLRKRKKHR